MKKVIIGLIAVGGIGLLLLNRDAGEIEYAEKKEDTYLFGIHTEKENFEIEYLDYEEKISLDAENNTFEDKVYFEMSSLFNDEIELTVKKVKVPAPFTDAEVIAYAFSTDVEVEGAMIIKIPYNGEDVGAGYYNEETKKWEPVMYSIDEENQQVVITTNHLSIYGSFTIRNEGTRFAMIESGLFEADDFLSQFRDSYQAVAKEAIANQMTPGGKAYDLGKGIIDNWMDASGALLTFEGIAYSSSYLSDLSDIMGNVGSAMVLAQIAIDYHRGDELTMAVNTWKSAVNYAVSTWGTKALQVSFVGVTAIDYALNQLADDMIQGRQDLWYKAYMKYYSENNQRSGRDWYNRIKELQEYANGPAQFERLLENELDNYTYLFWRESDDVLAFYQSDVMKQGFTGGGGLNDNLKTTIANEHKTHLLHQYLVPIFRQVERDLQLEMYQEYQSYLNELRTSLNQFVNFEVIDESEETDYANYIVQIAPLGENANPQQWRGRLNNEGTLKASFTVFGHLSSGAPHQIELYRNVRDYQNEEPTLVVDFILDVPHTIVYIDAEVDESATSFNISHTTNICPGGYGDYCEKYNQETLMQMTLSASGAFNVNSDDIKIETAISDGSHFKEESLIVTLVAPEGVIIDLRANLGISFSQTSGTYQNTQPGDWTCTWKLNFIGFEKGIPGTTIHESDTNIEFENTYFSGDFKDDGGLMATVGSSAQNMSRCVTESRANPGEDIVNEGRLFSIHNGPRIYVILEYK